MIDAHVHLEKGEYSLSWIDEFIKYALDRGIDEIFFLEHTHIFKECESLYREMSAFNPYQKAWFTRKCSRARPISDYLQFIEQIKAQSLPVKTKFGLEVCYSPEHEKDIETMKRLYPFDFLVGSIHFIDGWAFSHLRQPWKKEDHNLSTLYSRYYELMERLIQSGLFSGLAHPNSLQCFGAYPQADYTETYERLARSLKQREMYIEQSSGLAINYGDSQLGMPSEMLESMLRYNVSILTASDAHVPQNVGILIPEMSALIASRAAEGGRLTKQFSRM